MKLVDIFEAPVEDEDLDPVGPQSDEARPTHEDPFDKSEEKQLRQIARSPIADIDLSDQSELIGKTTGKQYKRQDATTKNITQTMVRVLGSDFDLRNPQALDQLSHGVTSMEVFSKALEPFNDQIVFVLQSPVLRERFVLLMRDATIGMRADKEELKRFAQQHVQAHEEK